MMPSLMAPTLGKRGMSERRSHCDAVHSGAVHSLIPSDCRKVLQAEDTVTWLHEQHTRLPPPNTL